MVSNDPNQYYHVTKLAAKQATGINKTDDF